MKRTKLVGFALTFAFLALVLWRVDLGEFAAALSSANYWYVGPAAVSTLAGYVVRTVRWRVLLKPSRPIPLANLFSVLMIGFMANNLLPARIGEVVRAYTLGSREGISKSYGLATIVLERLFDGITLLLFFTVLSFAVPLPGWGNELALVSALVFGAASCGLLGLLFQRRVAFRLVSGLARPLPDRISARAQHVVALFITGLDVLKGRTAVVATLCLSVIVWTLEAISYFLIMQGFSLGLEGWEQLFATVFLLVVVNIGIMLPSAPGYVGTFQFFGVLALGAFGVARELSLSVAVVSHAMQYVLVTSIGLISLWLHNLSFHQIAGEEHL